MPTKPPGLHDLTFAELQAALATDGVRPFHAATLFAALYQDLDPDPASRKDLVAPLRRWLHEKAPSAPPLQESSVTESADGWTRKFLLTLNDGQAVESVLMGFPGRFTGCLSTQVGCAMGCVFCATGQMGFVRNLSVGEIVGQALHLQRLLRGRQDRLRNLVLMGMGEPLHNFDAVMQALEILSDTRGCNIGPARITISTVGHVPGILRLARQPRRYRLAVSLHGGTDEERAALVPINQRWPLRDLIAACREYISLTGERIFVAWTLIDGKNDSVRHARDLGALLRGLDVHVNLIPLNPTEGFVGSPSAQAAAKTFQATLAEGGIPSTIRQRRGIDVAAGCGQLRSTKIPHGGSNRLPA